MNAREAKEKIMQYVHEYSGLEVTLSSLSQDKSL